MLCNEIRPTYLSEEKDIYDKQFYDIEIQDDVLFVEQNIQTNYINVKIFTQHVADIQSHSKVVFAFPCVGTCIMHIIIIHYT